MKTDIEDWSNDAENPALLSQKIIYFFLLFNTESVVFHIYIYIYIYIYIIRFKHKRLL